jgi:PadR family transcriptional regulator PadR
MVVFNLNSMIAEQIKSQMRKGILEYCVMQILLRGEVYASDLIEELQQANLLAVEGIIYPLLLKFKHEGLLTYEWVNSESGLPKKHYQLTDEGKQTANQLADELHALLNTTKAFEAKSVNDKSETNQEK